MLIMEQLCLSLNIQGINPSRTFLRSTGWGAPSPALRCTSPGPKTRRSHVYCCFKTEFGHSTLSCLELWYQCFWSQEPPAWQCSAQPSPLGPPLAPIPPGKQNQEASASAPPGPGCSSSFLRCCQSHSGLNPSAGKGHGCHREGGLIQQPLEIHLKSYLVANSQPGFSRSLNAPCGEASRMRRHFL